MISGTPAAPQRAVAVLLDIVRLLDITPDELSTEISRQLERV